MTNLDLPISEEEIRLLLGHTPGQQWSIWLTQRMRDYLKARQLNLVYVSSGPQTQVLRLYNATPVTRDFPSPCWATANPQAPQYQRPERTLADPCR